MAISHNWRCVFESPLIGTVAPSGWRQLKVDAGAVTAVVVEVETQEFGILYEGSPSRATLDHCLNDLVVPRLLAFGGDLVLHAGVIAVPTGAIGFLGPSGQGKSTLTGSLKLRGLPVISDDSALLQSTPSGWHARQISSTLRLFPDSIEQLFPDVPSTTPMADYTNKRHIPLSKQADSQPLTALFRIGEPAENIKVDRLASGDAFMAIIANAFALDPTDPEETSRRFAKAAGVASDIPVFDLHYPRDYALLPTVHSVIFSALDLALAAEPVT